MLLLLLNALLSLILSFHCLVLSCFVCQALPYLQQFQSKTIVIKYGGAAMKSASLKQQVMHDIVLMRCVGMRPVLVHGGGPEISNLMNKVSESRVDNFDIYIYYLLFIDTHIQTHTDRQIDAHVLVL